MQTDIVLASKKKRSVHAEDGCTSRTKTVYIILAYYSGIMLDSYVNLLCCLFFRDNFLMPTYIVTLLI